MTLLPDASELGALIVPELHEGESVVWCGQPVPRMIIKREIGGIFIGGILLGAALAAMINLVPAVFETNDSESAVIMVSILSGVILMGLLPGLFFVSSPYWSWRKAKRTYYVITNRRAILFQANCWKGMTVYSYEPSQLRRLRRVQFAEGSGHLFFEPDPTDVGGERASKADLGFLGLDDVKQVADAIDALVRPREAASPAT
jgi:hypothetical protein